MQSFDRKAHWQSIYSQKNTTEVSWYQAEPVISLELIANCGLRKTDPIIDVGGGASTLVDHLIDRGYRRVSVLDISNAALAAARKRLGAKAAAATWIEADITLFTPPSKFALWHDRAVFHFLTDARDRRDYVQALRNGLRVGGHLVVASFAIGGPGKCSGLPVIQYDAEKLGTELGPEFDLLEERSEKHVTPGQRVQEFAYFHFVRKREYEP